MFSGGGVHVGEGLLAQCGVYGTFGPMTQEIRPPRVRKRLFKVELQQRPRWWNAQAGSHRVLQ